MEYRPWGQLSWLTGKLPHLKWDIICGISPEDRSLEAYEFLKINGHVLERLFLQVEDPQSSRFYTEVKDELDRKEQLLLAAGEQQNTILRFQLFSRLQEIVNIINAFLDKSTGNLILDISVLPKRFFFPIIKLAYRHPKIRTLVCANTKPESYASDALSEDPEPWLHLPLFAPPFPEREAEFLIIGVGFQTLGLPDLVEANYHDIKAKLLFPFPPGAPNFQRTWGFVQRIERNFQKKANYIAKVDTNDVSEAFDHISAITTAGKHHSILAPYGPKTISLAMCIYGCITDSPAYYTQPKTYNPKYSTGVSRIDGHSQIFGYCLKLEGRELYKL